MNQPVEFWRLQKAADMDNHQAAAFLGVRLDTVKKWRAGKPAPLAVIKLMQYHLLYKGLKNEEV